VKRDGARVLSGAGRIEKQGEARAVEVIDAARVNRWRVHLGVINVGALRQLLFWSVAADDPITVQRAYVSRCAIDDPRLLKSHILLNTNGRTLIHISDSQHLSETEVSDTG